MKLFRFTLDCYTLVDILSAGLAGLILTVFFIDFYGGQVNRSPASLSDTNKIESHEACSTLTNRNTTLPWDLVLEAEDNFWEIEYFDGKYYRVRREDWEGIYGKYEFDGEEEIGDIKDLQEYVDNNNEMPME